MIRQNVCVCASARKVSGESAKSAIKINRKAIKGEALECERERYNLRANCGAEVAQNVTRWQQVTTKLFHFKMASLYCELFVLLCPRSQLWSWNKSPKIIPAHLAPIHYGTKMKKIA
jgi:hypothetical protein